MRWILIAFLLSPAVALATSETTAKEQAVAICKHFHRWAFHLNSDAFLFKEGSARMHLFIDQFADVDRVFFHGRGALKPGQNQ